MLKLLLISAGISILSLSNDSNVYICDSENTIAYHLKKDCRGIHNCDEEIIEMTEKEALEKKLRLCKWED